MSIKEQAHKSCEGSDGAMEKDEILKKITPEQFDSLLKTMEALKHSKPSSVTFPPPFRSKPTFWDKVKAFLGMKSSDTFL